MDIMMTLFDEEQIMCAYVESEKKETAEKATVISVIEICQEMGLPVSETIKRLPETINLKKTMHKHGFGNTGNKNEIVNSFHMSKIAVLLLAYHFIP